MNDLHPIIVILMILSIAIVIVLPIALIVRHYDPADPTKLLRRIEALEERIEFLEEQTGDK